MTPDATTPATDGSNARRQQILRAAFEAFRQYGYRRTSMEDIARAAGMSRAALYLYFRNKEDVFRSLSQAYFTAAQARMAEALQPALPVRKALGLAFQALLGPELQAFFETAHGAELFDAKRSIGADVIRQGEADLAVVLAAWLEAEARAGRVALAAFGDDARQIAATMLSAKHGLKAVASSFDSFTQDVARLAEMFGAALEVDQTT